MNLTFKKNKVWSFYKWMLFIVILESLRASFFWHIPISFFVPLLFILISIIVISLIPQYFSFRRKSVFNIMILYLVSYFAATRGNLNAYLGMLIMASSFLFFAGLKNQYKKEFFEFFIRVLSVLLTISLLGWILYLLGVNLPNFDDFYGFSERRNEAQYLYSNYYIFLVNLNAFTDIILPRFSSFFLEPGYLGVMLVVLLYINKFNFKKKQNIILLVALFFTFSLAGWLLGIIAYIAFRIKESDRKVFVFISLTIFMLSFNLFFSTYNNGDNVVNELILSRLQYDDSRGTISGYNRTGEDFDKWFSQEFLVSDDVLFGLDMKKLFGETSAVGWKVYMVNYGLVGLFLYLLFLFYVYNKHRNYDNFVLFIIYILIFARGHHIIYWSAFPILYLSGCVILDKKNS